jgi:hypothetical protein
MRTVFLLSSSPRFYKLNHKSRKLYRLYPQNRSVWRHTLLDARRQQLLTRAFRQYTNSSEYLGLLSSRTGQGMQVILKVDKAKARLGACWAEKSRSIKTEGMKRLTFPSSNSNDRLFIVSAELLRTYAGYRGSSFHPGPSSGRFDLRHSPNSFQAKQRRFDTFFKSTSSTCLDMRKLRRVGLMEKMGERSLVFLSDQPADV